MGASRIYRLATAFNAVDLAEVDQAQQADVVYFGHLNYPPQKVVRSDHTDWEWAEVPFGPTAAAPAGLTATPTVANNDDTLSDGSVNNNPQYYPLSKVYAVASVNAAGQESRLSNTDEATNDLSLKGNFNTLSWTADPDAVFYNIYAQANGSQSMGYLGRSETNSFIDNEGGVDPDYADTPRFGDNPFATDGNYPSTVAFHDQSLVWGRTRTKPNGVWKSQSGDIENMDKSRIAKPDDAMAFALAGEKVNAVQQLVSMKSLVALTSDGIFSITGPEGGTLTIPPETKREVATGAARLNPILLDSVLAFRPNKGSAVRMLGFTFEIDGFKSNNVAIFSPHFFNGFDIVSWDYQNEPFSIIWAARSDGALLAFTWEQDQQVWGWTLCETSGYVEQVAVITEGGVDRVYLAVRRTVGGSENVFIERMALPVLVADDLVESCYLDCAVTQVNDPPSATCTGLSHLEGETVTAFADGYVVEDLVVEDGQVTLEFDAETITVGLPYSGEIETLPLALGAKHVDRQTIAEVTIRVDKTRGLKVGITGGLLVEIRQRETEELDAPITLKTGDFHQKLSSKWSDGATLRVVQDYPLPATISALFPTPVVNG